MKNLILIAACIMSSGILFAQKEIKVEEKTGECSQGKQNCLSVDIPDARVDNVEKGWKNVMKDYKAKSESKKDEIFTDNVTIGKISDNTIDVYADFTETDAGTTMQVFFDLGGAYLNSSMHADQTKFAIGMIHDFAVQEAKNAIQDEVDKEAKTLASLQKDQKNLEKDNEDLHQSIDDYNDKIKKAQDDIKVNEKDQEAKKADIDNQQKVLDAVKKKLDGVE